MDAPLASSTPDELRKTISYQTQALVLGIPLLLISQSIRLQSTAFE